MRLWLVRHGETEWNARRRFQSRTDLPLDEAGRRQAARVSTELRGTPFAAVWSSDLRRAVETARIAWGSPIQDRRLREIDLGHLEGKVWAELDPDIQAGLARFEGFVAPGGESYEQFRDRVLEWLGELEPGDHLVFTHGGVIRLLLRTFGHEDRFPAPGSVTTIEVDPST